MCLDLLVGKLTDDSVTVNDVTPDELWHQTSILHPFRELIGSCLDVEASRPTAEAVLKTLGQLRFDLKMEQLCIICRCVCIDE